MKLSQLEYFCAVCRYHSITEAAQKLYVTQPAISAAVKALEKEFSVSLLNRTKNHIALTREGELFYQKASALLETVSQASQEFYDLGQQTSTIRIGIPPLLSTLFFPDMLLAFEKEYPEIPVQLLEYGSIRAAKLVEEDVLDLGIVNMDFCEIDRLDVCQILAEKVVFCVCPEHPLAGEKKITLEMLKDEPLIMYNTDSVLNATLQSRFENAGIKPHVILKASQLYTIQNFVLKNTGGAFLYASIAKNMDGLVSIPVTPVIRQEIGLVWQKGKYMNSSAEKFISFTKKYVRWIQ